jgi:hypothetical protein
MENSYSPLPLPMPKLFDYSTEEINSSRLSPVNSQFTNNSNTQWVEMNRQKVPNMEIGINRIFCWNFLEFFGISF